jgi:septum formation protein
LRPLADLNTPTLILASTSAYRRALLERLRLPFEVVAPDVDETPLPGEPPMQTALRLAAGKAAAAMPVSSRALVIGSDQVAVLNEQRIGKPGDHAAALKQLQAMRGRLVVFHTALCLLNTVSGRKQVENVPTRVFFRNFSDTQIEHYLRAEQPYDCAGSAKIEGLGIALVERIESDDPTALIGLPLMKLATMLQNEGLEVIPGR